MQCAQILCSIMFQYKAEFDYLGSMNAATIIEQLGMMPHPEGGFYKETYRATSMVQPADGRTERNTSTAIYYLLADEDKSHFHRVASDELWFFHQGATIEIYIIQHDGTLSVKLLGNNLLKGETPQVTVAANQWFAAKIQGDKGFALVSCTVAPGFAFEDFELADREILRKQYPALSNEILQLSIEKF